MRIRVLAFEGADEIDIVAPYSVFKRAAKRVGDLDVRLVTLDGARSVTGGQGLEVEVEGTLEPDVTPDLVVVPGGGWVDGAAQGVRAEISRGALPRKVESLYREGAAIAGVCTGTLVLAASGILAGRSATTHRTAMGALRDMGIRVVEARVVDTGDIVTCGGVTSSFDLSLWLVERCWGAELASSIAASIEYTRSADIHVERHS